MKQTAPIYNTFLWNVRNEAKGCFTFVFSNKLLNLLLFSFSFCHRVAESPECKMSVSNLAKVFGPSIVGGSSSDCTATLMLKEVQKQLTVCVIC
jgi:hypothetical protein